MNQNKKNIWYMGLTSFFTDVSSEMIFPILPLFLTTVLKANMAIIGLIEGIAESASALLKLVSGWISDKIGRKTVLVIGLVLFALTSLGFAFIANNFTIWILFAFYGLFMAVTDGVSRAYVSDLTVKEKRGTALGVYHTFDGIMVFPANFIGGILWQKINVQAPFVYAAILSLISAFLLLILIRKKE